MVMTEFKEVIYKYRKFSQTDTLYATFVNLQLNCTKYP